MLAVLPDRVNATLSEARRIIEDGRRVTLDVIGTFDERLVVSELLTPTNGGGWALRFDQADLKGGLDVTENVGGIVHPASVVGVQTARQNGHAAIRITKCADVGIDILQALDCSAAGIYLERLTDCRIGTMQTERTGWNGVMGFRLRDTDIHTIAVRDSVQTGAAGWDSGNKLTGCLNTRVGLFRVRGSRGSGVWLDFGHLGLRVERIDVADCTGSAVIVEAVGVPDWRRAETQPYSQLSTTGSQLSTVEYAVRLDAITFQGCLGGLELRDAQDVQAPRIVGGGLPQDAKSGSSIIHVGGGVWPRPVTDYFAEGEPQHNVILGPLAPFEHVTVDAGARPLLTSRQDQGLVSPYTGETLTKDEHKALQQERVKGMWPRLPDDAVVKSEMWPDMFELAGEGRFVAEGNL